MHIQTVSPTPEGGWTESQSAVDSPYYSLEALVPGVFAKAHCASIYFAQWTCEIMYTDDLSAALQYLTPHCTQELLGV